MTRDVVVKVRMSASERARLKRVAKRLGQTESAALRLLVALADRAGK